MMDSATNPLNSLANKRIVLGITGGIAAYKCAELVRLLRKADAHVQVVMTQSATEFVTPATLQALSGQTVYSDMWHGASRNVPNFMPHIELTRDADAVLIAPATSNMIAKLVSGVADDLLSTLCVARPAKTLPLLIAPAMNVEMWQAEATQRNIAQLQADGVHVIGPEPGEQACGEVGLGRMSEPATIVNALAQLFNKDLPLAGQHVLLTAGPTQEPIDPVRVITNLSSGKMGYALAEAFAAQGARVTLISGPTALATPKGVARVNVQTAAQMLVAALQHINSAQVFCAVAAVADYTPAAPSDAKIKKSDAALSIALTPTVDILARVAALPTPPFCIGFAAESHDVLAYARAKRLKKKIPMIIANHAGTALGADDNAVTIIDDRGEVEIAAAPKRAIAKAVVQHYVHHYTSKLRI
jgi:phosphopantothenoylcysteine decarboxylase / phosphopantothenate---cysteine ligase